MSDSKSTARFFYPNYSNNRLTFRNYANYPNNPNNTKLTIHKNVTLTENKSIDSKYNNTNKGKANNINNADNNTNRDNNNANDNLTTSMLDESKSLKSRKPYNPFSTKLTSQLSKIPIEILKLIYYNLCIDYYSAIQLTRTTAALYEIYEIYLHLPINHLCEPLEKNRFEIWIHDNINGIIQLPNNLIIPYSKHNPIMFKYKFPTIQESYVVKQLKHTNSFILAQDQDIENEQEHDNNNNQENKNINNFYLSPITEISFQKQSNLAKSIRSFNNNNHNVNNILNSPSNTDSDNKPNNNKPIKNIQYQTINVDSDNELNNNKYFIPPNPQLLNAKYEIFQHRQSDRNKRKFVSKLIQSSQSNASNNNHNWPVNYYNFYLRLKLLEEPVMKAGLTRIIRKFASKKTNAAKTTTTTGNY